MPSRLPNITFTPLPPPSAAARSSVPSELKSPTASETGLSPAAEVELAERALAVAQAAR